MTSEMLLEQFYGGAELKLTHSGTLGRPKSSPEASFTAIFCQNQQTGHHGIVNKHPSTLCNRCHSPKASNSASSCVVHAISPFFTHFTTFLVFLSSSFSSRFMTFPYAHRFALCRFVLKEQLAPSLIAFMGPPDHNFRFFCLVD